MTPKRRFVTIIYEIVDDAKWQGVNPLRYEHHGLKSVGVSAGDLMALRDALEEHVDPDAWAAALGNTL